MNILIQKILTLSALFFLSLIAVANDDKIDINKLTQVLEKNPKSVIETTESLIDDSRTKSNLQLRFLQIKAYVANDLDIRMIPKIEKIKSLARELNESAILFEILIYQAMIAKRYEHYSEALQYNYEALKRSKRLNTPEVETRALKNIAKLYLELEHYKKSIANYDKALLINHNNEDISSNIIMEKGLVYLAMGNYFQAKKMLLSALKTMKKSQKKMTLLNVYLGRLYVTMGDYSKALSYLESLSLEEINNLPSEAKRGYFEYQAKAYLQQGDFDKAIKIAKKQLSNAFNTRFLVHQTNLKKIISQSYFQKFDYENAYTYLHRHVLLQQAIHEKLRDSKVLQLEAQFTKQKQESRIKLLEQNSALQKSLYDNQMIAQAKLYQEEQYNQKLWVISLITSFIGLFFILRQLQVRKHTQKLEDSVRERTKELADKNKKLNEISFIDQLTGLHNRHFLYQTIEKDISRVNRYYQQKTFTLDNLKEKKEVNLSNKEQDLIFILVDLDHFKQVNDQYGHSVGDSVLVEMKNLITKTFRESDYFIRWGGEEFLIVTRYVDRNIINIMVERFRKAVANHNFTLNENSSIKCTCSIGFAAYPFMQNQPKAFTWEQVIDIADAALYTAKKKQRNAWVGLSLGEHVNTQINTCSFLDRIKNDTDAVIDEGIVKYSTSIKS